MFTNKNNLKTFAASLLIGLGLTLLHSGSASAATLNVGTGCTLSEAVTAINAGVDGLGCLKTDSDAYGTNDTISLPAGTFSLSADLPALTKGVKVEGTGKSSSFVDANGHLGFNALFENADRFVQDFTFSDLAVKNADQYAISIQGAKSVTIDKVDISNSKKAVAVMNCQNVTVSNSLIHNNVDTDLAVDDRFVGLSLGTIPYTPTTVPTLNVTDTKVYSNSGRRVGIILDIGNEVQNGEGGVNSSSQVKVKNAFIKDNTAEDGVGITIVENGGPFATSKVDLVIEAVTIANNTVTVTIPDATPSLNVLPVTAGFLVTGNLSAQQNFRNVTVAYNTINNPAPDTRRSIAGFVASLAKESAPLSILNNTIVGNSVVQPASPLSIIPSFFAVRIELDPNTFSVTDIRPGATATNTLVSHNSYNGLFRNCWNSIDGTLLGLAESQVDGTPVDQGSNMSDDQTCTGYKYVPGLNKTISTVVTDNGGPVPTVKLLPGSPAINGGTAVLGITTDARGVARIGYYSVGAYQGQLLAESTAKPKLAATGVMIPAVGLGMVVFFVVTYTYFDYLKHRKPLVQADPFARNTYTYGHHINAVTIPLLRYRIHISFNRNPSGIKKF